MSPKFDSFSSMGTKKLLKLVEFDKGDLVNYKSPSKEILSATVLTIRKSTIVIRLENGKESDVSPLKLERQKKQKI